MLSCELRIEDIGRRDYARALAHQRALHERVVAGDAGPTVLFVEHDAVITVSQRRNAQQHVLADQHRLTALGIDVQPTDRGGDVTYHGPGQLVAYPILRLTDLRFNVGKYIRFLEQVIIDTAAMFDIAAVRVEKCTGVWVDTAGSAEPQAMTPATACATNAGMGKLAAIGVRVKRNVTLHGLALNVTTNLDHFQTIVPCGLANRNVASLQQLLSDACPTMDEVKAAMAQQFQRHYRAALPVCDVEAR